MFYRHHDRVTYPAPGQDAGELVTKQAHKAECDIHNILRQYQRTGILTHVQAARPTYEDLPDNIDFQTAQNTIIAAQQAFDALPAKVRDHFANDPARFLASFSDPEQEAQLRIFGLLSPKAPPEDASGSAKDEA